MTNINITQEDIDAGVAGECYGCPGALALNRVLKEGYYCKVGIDHITIYHITKNINDDPYEMVMTMPRKLVLFVGQFDTGYAVIPIELKLDIPERYLK